MVARGWAPLSVHADTAARIKEFQIRAIAETQTMLTISEALDLAVKLAAEKLMETRTNGDRPLNP